MITGKKWLRYLCYLVIEGAAIAFSISNGVVKAQVTPDQTLGTESSVVTPNVEIKGVTSDRIDGGAMRATNLFHSFQEFNIGEGKGVYFTNPTGIENIFSRVTGGNISQILGKLGVLGNANLFFLNPNGIIFGPNATLDVQGSFIATTANSIFFTDGWEFSTKNPQNPPLLTISVPIGLQFGTGGGNIEVKGPGSNLKLDETIESFKSLNRNERNTGIMVQPGKTLGLLGGDIWIEGGNLTAESGQIALFSVKQGELSLSIGKGKFKIESGQNLTHYGNIQLTKTASLDVSGEGSGNVWVEGANVTLKEGSAILAITDGGNLGGNLLVRGRESVEIQGADKFPGGLFAQTSTTSTGDAGNLTIFTTRLLVSDKAQISTTTFGAGRGGKLEVKASEFIEIIGSTEIDVTGLSAETWGTGAAGNLTIDTGKLILREGGQISGSTLGKGRGGQLNVIASEVQVIGEGVSFVSGIFTQSNDTGDSGNLTIETSSLTVLDGGLISVGTRAAGEGGELKIIAKDSVELIGQRRDGRGSRLISGTVGTGNGGNLIVDTPRLIVKDGAEISVSSVFGTVIGRGSAGNLEIKADKILLDNQGKLTAATAVGSQGNINLQGEQIVLNDNSEISTNAIEEANGGNITINSNVLAVNGSSKITANAISGEGGNINLTTQGLFVSSNSEISATSEKGIDGVVELNDSEIIQNQSFAILETDLIDVTELVSQSLCNQEQGSEFVFIGKGGLPPNPAERISSRIILLDLGKDLGETEIKTGQIVEAQGWEINALGQVTTLTASTPATALLEEGRQLYQVGEYTKAAAIFQQAAESFASFGDKLNYALSLSNWAAALQELGNWEEARKAINTSLVTLEQLPPSPEQMRIKALTLNNLGSLELFLGRFTQAAATWQWAASLYAQSGNEAGVIRSSVNYSQALFSLGLNLQAVRVLEGLQDRIAQAITAERAAVIRSYGDALRFVGDIEKSEAVLQESLQQAQELQSPWDISAALVSLGNTASAAGDTKAALEYYQQAATTSNIKIKLEAQINQLSLLVEEKRFLAARNLWPIIQPEINQLRSTYLAVYAKINFAQSLRQLDVPPEEIAKELELALQQARILGDKRAEAYALGYLGSHYENNQLWETARQLTEQALLLSQELKAPDLTYRWQWQLGRILKTQGDTKGAIAAYTDAFNILRSLRADLAATNRELQFSFRDTVEPVYRELVGLLLQGNSQEQENLIQARQIIEALQLAELDNFFQDACSTAQPVEIDQVDQNAGVIYPIILADRLEVILSLPGKPLRHYSTPISQEEVEITLERLQNSLFLADPVNRLTVPDEYLPFAQTVYDWLIRPIENDLAASEIKTLVFIPDKSFGNIPMAVLHDGSQHLIEKYAIALTPGLQLLEPQPLQQIELNALTAGLTKATQGFPPLPNVAQEIEVVEQEVPSHVLLNQEFTSEAVAEEIATSPHPIIHLATHGQFSSKAEDTFILTWDDRIDANELSELLRSESRTDTVELLVLSACQTATGDNRAALGLAGVAVRAGARSTLATLWFVDDQATAEAMSLFYQQLNQEKLTKAEALRRAQVSLLQNPQFQHPFYWAPYVLVGNWL